MTRISISLLVLLALCSYVQPGAADIDAELRSLTRQKDYFRLLC